MAEKSEFQQKVSEELIDLAKAGDVAAFEHIYESYAGNCYALAMRLCGNHSTAQDIVHETFIKVFKNLQSYRGNGVFAAWLKRITTNESINRIKSMGRIHLVGEDELIANESNDLFASNWVDACRDLNKLLGKLSETARAVLILHEVEGYTHKEIAKLFDKTEGFSKATLSRAYAALKKLALTEREEKKNASQ